MCPDRHLPVADVLRPAQVVLAVEPSGVQLLLGIRRGFGGQIGKGQRRDAKRCRSFCIGRVGRDGINPLIPTDQVGEAILHRKGRTAQLLTDAPDGSSTIVYSPRYIQPLVEIVRGGVVHEPERDFCLVGTDLRGDEFLHFHWLFLQEIVAGQRPAFGRLAVVDVGSTRRKVNGRTQPRQEIGRDRVDIVQQIARAIYGRFSGCAQMQQRSGALNGWRLKRQQFRYHHIVSGVVGLIGEYCLDFPREIHGYRLGIPHPRLVAAAQLQGRRPGAAGRVFEFQVERSLVGAFQRFQRPDGLVAFINFHRSDVRCPDVVGGYAVATPQHIHSFDVETVDLFAVIGDLSALFHRNSRHFLQHLADGAVGTVAVLGHGID